MVALSEDMVVAGRFRLVRMIGKGGMGSVWRAMHLALDTPCAVKFIEGALTDSADAHARFEREAKAAAQLRSQNVVQILEHGVWEGRPYIAMELLEGEDLGKHLAHCGGRLAPADVCFVVQHVCRALSRAHQAGVVHRDLKPDNIFVVRDDDRDIVKILDFGVAKSTATAGGGNTKTGALIGTPYYMSPEQAQGTKGVDARSDLWSLAVIVFQCLAGRRPFESEAIGDLLLKIMVAPMPVPSEYFAGVPAGFDGWWAKAAQRDPDARYQTAKEFAESLSLALGQSSSCDMTERKRMQRGGDNKNRASATMLGPLETESAAGAADAPRPDTPAASIPRPPGPPEAPGSVRHPASASQTQAAESALAPTRLALERIRMISGDEEVRALIDGLSEGIGGALAKNSAFAVKTDPAGVDFLVKGSVQAVGKRVRLSFALEEVASGTQVWAERYDRQLDDVFGLQDEIVEYLASALRSRIKLAIFERLRDADDATLSVSQLLDKAAGLYQVASLERSRKAVAAVRCALERVPGSSMAIAMMSHGLFLVGEYDARALPPEQVDEIVSAAERAVIADPQSYVARTMQAIAAHDLTNDSVAAQAAASEALRKNATYVAARAIHAITEIHVGEVAGGLQRLQQVIASSTEHPSSVRHRRELALAHWLNGDPAEGLRIATSLLRESPETKRNAVVLVGLSGLAGKPDEARRHVTALKNDVPGITLATARLPWIGDPAARERFRSVLEEAGL